MPADPLDGLIERLEQTAAELRGGELTSERAAELVEACARLAAEAGSTLDHSVRASDHSGSGQLPLA